MAFELLLLSLVAAVATALPQPGVSQVDPLPAFTNNYDPERQNVYHLFTRLNPSISQPILPFSDASLSSSNYDGSKRTVLLVHGWLGRATDEFNAIMAPALLEAEDLNVISLDWNAGAGTFNYEHAMANTITSAAAVARFLTWLNRSSGSNLSNLHIIGYSLGAQQSGNIGRNLNGEVAYITGLDPALPGWVEDDRRFSPNDGRYTEIIHTDVGIAGYIKPLGQVDFYPNGGSANPGCVNSACNHLRAVFFMAESIRTGGFTGTRCVDYEAALRGDCTSEETLQMGGLKPKTGASGVFYLRTNASPPFSRG